MPCLGLLAALVLAGCTEGNRQTYATEADEPFYREGQALLKSGRRQEALNAFLKVVERRGDDAPESHLEAGLLYQQHFRDPLSAIYHYNRFLAARLNSPQAPMVKQRIDSAKREFAQTLPARPLEEQAQRVDLIAAFDKLKLENDLLKQQIADLQAGRDTGSLATVTTAAEPAQPGPLMAGGDSPSAREGRFNLSLESMPTVRTTTPRTAPAASANPAPVRTVSTQPPGRVPGSLPQVGQTQAPRVARKHKVEKGDTLSSLSQRYYGNRTRWRDIYAANKASMKSESDIRIGLELVIPP